MSIRYGSLKAALAVLLLALVLAQLLAALARPLMDDEYYRYDYTSSSETSSGNVSAGASGISSGTSSDSYWDAQYKRYSSYERNLEGSGYGGSSEVGSSSSSGTSTGSTSGSSSGLLGAVGNALSGVAQAVASAVSSATGTIGQAVSSAARAVAGAVSGAAGAFSSAMEALARVTGSVADTLYWTLRPKEDRELYSMGVNPGALGFFTVWDKEEGERAYAYLSGTRSTPWLVGSANLGAPLVVPRVDAEPEPVQRHRECINRRCVLVLGPGPDKCRTDADCQCPPQNINQTPPSFHAECVSMRCVLVPGSGQDQCRTDADCSPPKDRLIFDFIPIQLSTTKGGSEQTPPPGETPLATLGVEAVAMRALGAPPGSFSVAVSYAGTLSGSQSTPFTLSSRGALVEALTAPQTVTLEGVTYDFVEWRVSDGSRSTSATVRVTVPAGSTLTVTAVYRERAERPRVVEVGMGTLFLPGEAVPMPWLDSRYAWSGTWLVNVTERFRVGEHLVAVLWDGSREERLVLQNGTVLSVTLPPEWRSARRRSTPGGEILYLDDPRCLPRVGELYFLGLAAWDPTKQGYDTSSWLSNGTTLAVYNVTYTYDFGNGTRVVFVQPVVVSTVRVTVEPVYSYGDLRQGLALRVAVEWRYLPPARLGLGVSPLPETVVAAVSIGGRVYAGRLVGVAGASSVFEVPVTNDTWQLYVSGARSLSVEAMWLTSYGEPGAPVKMQESRSFRLSYAMPHAINSTEGSSFTGTFEFIDVETDELYSADFYVEFREWGSYRLVSAHGLFRVPGRAAVSIPASGTKQYAMVIYAVPVRQPEGRIVVPIAAVYAPRA
jgi:hypothetical protein